MLEILLESTHSNQKHRKNIRNFLFHIEWQFSQQIVSVFAFVFAVNVTQPCSNGLQLRIFSDQRGKRNFAKI